MPPLFTSLCSVVAGLTLLISSCATPTSTGSSTAYDRANDRDAYYDDAEQARMETWRRGPDWGGSINQPVDARTMKGILGHPPSH